MIELLGWASSLLLLVTIASQIVKQWQERSARGVSRWLFIGQALSSLGFLAYSALVHNWVFTLTNGLLLVSALVGAVITLHFKRQQAGKHPPADRVTAA